LFYQAQSEMVAGRDLLLFASGFLVSWTFFFSFQSTSSPFGFHVISKNNSPNPLLTSKSIEKNAFRIPLAATTPLPIFNETEYYERMMKNFSHWNKKEIARQIDFVLQQEQNVFCLLSQLLTIPSTLILSNGKYGHPSLTYPLYTLQNDIVSSALQSKGTWEVELSLAIMEKLKVVEIQYPNEPIAFLDIGGNLGAMSFYVAANGYQVYTFEPLAINILSMRLTQCLNPSFNMTLFPTALGPVKKTCPIISENINQGDGHIWCDQDVPRNYVIRGVFKVNTLDDFIDIIPMRIGAMKMDVEGYEGPVLQGAMKFFRKNRIPYIVTELGNNMLKGGISGTEYLTMWDHLGYEIRLGSFSGSVYPPAQFWDLLDGGIDNLFLTLR